MGRWGSGGLSSTTAWGGGLLFEPCWWRDSTSGFVPWYACWTVGFLYLFLNDSTDTLSSKRKDYRTRRDRIERQVQAWKLVLPHLVTAFLNFQQKGAPAVNEDDANLWGIEVISLEGPFKFPFQDRHWHFDRSRYTVLFTYAQRSVFCCHPCRIRGDTSVTRTAKTWFFHRNTSLLPTVTTCITPFQPWRILESFELLSFRKV